MKKSARDNGTAPTGRMVARVRRNQEIVEEEKIEAADAKRRKEGRE